MQEKKLYRSTKDRIFAGLCGGLGEYLDVDPVFIRVVWVLLVVFTGFVPGILAYFLIMFIVPSRPHGGALATTTIHLGAEEERNS